MAAIVISGLEKRYAGADAPAVAGIDLTIEDGEFVGLLGPNGAGKTTVLSILAGCRAPTRGSVTIRGMDLARNPFAVRSLIGFVPQDVALYPSLTARENLSFFGRMAGLGGRGLAARVTECLDLAGLGKNADRRVSGFSGGMKRRANLVAALLHSPPILILDEPTAGIDAQSRHVIFDALRRLNAPGGVTVIYATHYMEEAEQLCGRVVVIDGGRILQDGPPARLVAGRPGCRNLDELFLELTGRSLRD